MDAIQLVKKDHKTVEALFKQFERAEKAEKHSELKRIVRELIKELSVHAAIEEQILYPAMREGDEDAEDDVLEALEEHHLVKLTLLELDKMSPKDERYCAKVTVLMENVRHHVEEEEEELLPKLRELLEPKKLKELGELMEKAKRTAPTRPHPAAPDEPPGNLFAGAISALYDRGRDVVRDAADTAAKKVKSARKSAVRRKPKADAPSEEASDESVEADEEQPV